MKIKKELKLYSFLIANAAVLNAEEDGSRWVLKPQREGGGNNMYGPQVSSFLKQNRGTPILGGLTRNS